MGKSELAVKPIGQELVPSEDQNRFIINVICPVGSSIDYVDEMLRQGEDILADLRDPVINKLNLAGSPVLAFTVASVGSVEPKGAV